MKFFQNIIISISTIFSSFSMVFSQESKSVSENDHFKSLTNQFPDYCFTRGFLDVKSVALTFDDGPSELTNQILDILEKHDVRATFFWQGQNLTKYPEIVFKAANSGHELGNHSWDHPNGWDMKTMELWSSQILPTRQLFDSIFQMDIRNYRPPFGAITSEQVGFLSKNDQKVILWSISTLDWDTSKNTSNEIFETVRNDLHPGAIILMHDVDFGNTASEKIAGLERIILYVKERGYEFVTVSDLTESPQ